MSGLDVVGQPPHHQRQMWVLAQAERNLTKVTGVSDALENVSSFIKREGTGSIFGDIFTVRGFATGDNYFRDGVPFPVPGALNTNDIDRVEVLKGPASVLFGAAELGGIINLVSKKPLLTPYRQVEFSAGSFNTYRGAIDISGPLDPEQKIAYRINADYETSGSFRNFVNGDNFSVSPVISAALSKDTNISVSARISKESKIADEGIPVIGTSIPNVPRDRFLGEEFGKIDAAQTAHPNLQPHRITRPAAPDRPYTVMTIDRQDQFTDVSIDPYNSKILESKPWKHTLNGWLIDLHVHLFAGDLGGQIVGLVGVALLVLGITGILLWTGWRKLKIGFQIRWQTWGIAPLGLFATGFLIWWSRTYAAKPRRQPIRD